MFISHPPSCLCAFCCVVVRYCPPTFLLMSPQGQFHPVSQFHCHCFTQFHSFTQFHCFSVSLFHRFTHSFTRVHSVSLSCSFSIVLFQCFMVSMFHSFISHGAFQTDFHSSHGPVRPHHHNFTARTQQQTARLSRILMQSGSLRVLYVYVACLFFL